MRGFSARLYSFALAYQQGVFSDKHTRIRPELNYGSDEVIDSKEEHPRFYAQITEYQHLTAQHNAARVAAEGEATALREQLAHLKGQLQVRALM